MCTPGDDNVVICGTSVGSLVIFDMKDYESSNYRQDELNYDALLRKLHPDIDSEQGETNQSNLLKTLKSDFAIYYSTYSTDGFPNYFHYSPIKKLQFITKFGGSSAQIGAIDEHLILSTWSVIEI